MKIKISYLLLKNIYELELQYYSFKKNKNNFRDNLVLLRQNYRQSNNNVKFN